MSRLTRDGTAEPVSRDQILRHEREQRNIYFPCSPDHEQDWQPAISVTIHIPFIVMRMALMGEPPIDLLIFFIRWLKQTVDLLTVVVQKVTYIGTEQEYSYDCSP